MDKIKILVVDDNPEIRDVVHILLESEGYEVIEAEDGQDAMEKLSPDIGLIILDIMMPGKSGFRVCVEMREKTKAPILFLTAKTQDSDKSLGFSSGADDYLSKPFSYPELVSRVKALLRRYYVYKGVESAEEKEDESYIKVRDLTVNTRFNEVFMEGEEVDLSEIEYQILLLLCKNPRKIFSAQNLYESVWQEPHFYSSNNTVMVHIRKLRVQLEKDPQNPQYIKTVWGKGYRVE
ncbi:response regulator transcription factor [Anaerolentibacter hominis]|uniref:response regulator transcription factor n=1 Tax=Anaerolentibacter hominis TaxID=3079009 RepID=UPI0031B8980B